LESVESYVEYIKDLIKNKEGNSTEEYIKGVDCIQLNTLYKKHHEQKRKEKVKKKYEEEGKDPTTITPEEYEVLVSNTEILLSAYILGKLIDRICWDRMVTIQREDWSVMVWLNHDRFINSFKGLTVTPRNLSQYFSKLSQIGIIGHQVVGLNRTPQHFYYITKKGLNLYHTDLLGGYMRKVKMKSETTDFNDGKMQPTAL